MLNTIKTPHGRREQLTPDKNAIVVPHTWGVAVLTFRREPTPNHTTVLISALTPSYAGDIDLRIVHGTEWDPLTKALRGTYLLCAWVAFAHRNKDGALYRMLPWEIPLEASEWAMNFMLARYEHALHH